MRADMFKRLAFLSALFALSLSSHRAEAAFESALDPYVAVVRYAVHYASAEDIRVRSPWAWKLLWGSTYGQYGDYVRTDYAGWAKLIYEDNFWTREVFETVAPNSTVWINPWWSYSYGDPWKTNMMMNRMNLYMRNHPREALPLTLRLRNCNIHWLAEYALDLTLDIQEPIVFVSGSDLHIRYPGDEADSLFITAPAGKRIGRPTFAPDGSKVAYEVWTMSNGYPVISDLYIANGDGTSPQLLLGAGDLSDPSGKTEYDFTSRLLWGPAFSPDGTKVSCYRIQSYKGTGMDVVEKEVGYVPAAGGAFQPLFTDIDVPLGGTMGPSPWSSNFKYLLGANTTWRSNRIFFTRMGHWQMMYRAVCDATDTNRTTWPCTFYMEWNSEAGRTPIQLYAQVDGQTEKHGFPSEFVGYGDMKVTSAVPRWVAHINSEWNTPEAGAWYGPWTVNLPTGQYDVVFGGSLSFTLDENTDALGLDVVKGAVNLASSTGGPLIGPGAFIGSVSADGGGFELYMYGACTRSLAWNSIGTLLAADSPEYWDFIGTIIWSQGGSIGGESVAVEVLAEDQDHSYFGNWDSTDSRLVYCAGTNLDGSVFVYDIVAQSSTWMCHGSFPAFAPLYRTQVTPRTKEVTVTAPDGSGAVTCPPGHTVVVESGGDPQPAAPVRGAWVTNIIPAWGSAVANNTTTTIRIQFSTAIATNTIWSNLMTGVSWPAVGGDGAFSRYAGYTEATARLNDSNNPFAFNDTVTNVVKRGIGVASWNNGNTEFAFSITNQSFSRTNGSYCEFSIDLCGVRNASDVPLAFAEARTMFRFVEPVGTNGGQVCGTGPEKLIVPRSVLTSNVVITLLAGDLADAATLPPSTGRWMQVSPTYTFSPPGQTFASNVTVSLLLDGPYPGAAVWCYTGSSWTNLGGAYDPTNGLFSAQARRLGTFAVFYLEPTSLFFRVTKDADLQPTGNVCRFTITVQNLSTSNASLVTVTDRVATALAVLTNTITEGGTYNSGTRAISWTVGTLESNGAWRARFEAQITNSGVRVTNIATASSAQTGPTNSGPVVVQIGPALTTVRFGIGGSNSVNWTGMATLKSRYRRVPADITTAQAEDTNLISFAWFDAQVRSNQAVGARTYGIVNLSSSAGRWAAPLDFARAFAMHVERYDGDGVADMAGLTNAIVQWEIFDAFATNAGRWTGCSLGLYASYLSYAHSAAHGVHPGVTVLPSAFENVPEEGTNYLVRLIQEYDGIESCMDAIAVHDRWELTPYWTSSNTWVGQYLQSRTLLDMLDSGDMDDRELWITEADFTSTYDYWKGEGVTLTQTNSAESLARAFPGALAAGADHLIYTALDYDAAGTEAQRWASMLDSGGNKRMSFWVYQKMIEKLEGFTAAHLRDFGDCNYGAKFVLSNMPVWVVWNWTGVVSLVTLPIGPVSDARLTPALPASFNNSSASWLVTTNWVTDGIVAVTVSDVPLYVEPSSNYNADIDGDGVPNEEDNDMDGDGMTNGYEEANGMNPYVSDASLDFDGDHVSNLSEAMAGSNPDDSNSFLHCYTTVRSGGVIRVEWQSATGMTYRIDWAGNASASWSNAADGLITATNSRTVWYDSGPPKTPPFTSQPARCYRVRTAE